MGKVFDGWPAAATKTTTIGFRAAAAWGVWVRQR
jgi:hypothetical protein